MQLVDAAAAELGQHRREVDLAVGRWHLHQLDLACFEGLPACGVVTGGKEQHPPGRRQDASRSRRGELRVDDRAQRLARRGHQAHVEARIVLGDGADAGEQRAGALAPGVAIDAGRFAGDPLALPIGQGGAAVERDRGLEAQPGATALHARDEADVELARLGFEHAGLHGDAGGAQAGEALAGDERVRVAHRSDDAAHTGRDQGVGTRRRAPVVRARLEADVDGGPGHAGAARGSVAQGHDLGVRAAGFLRVAAADHLAAGTDDDAADSRVGLGKTDRPLGEGERFAHRRGRVEAHG